MPAGKVNFDTLWQPPCRWRKLRHKVTGEIVKMLGDAAWPKNQPPNHAGEDIGPWYGIDDTAYREAMLQGIDMESVKVKGWSFHEWDELPWDGER